MANVDILVTASDQASGTLKGIGGAVGGLGALGKVAAAGFAALAAAIAGAGAAIALFVDASADAEESQARFNSMVGGSKLADFTDEMQAMATALSQVTRFEDENILEAEGMLSLYQNIGQDIFPQVIETALDLAEVLKTDATGGAETLGRALSDIAEGSLMMLARSRLITKEQQEMAEEMAKAGDEAGAQAYILDILNGKIGDLAETMGQTFKGSITIFKNNLGNMAEALGDKFMPLLTPLIGKLDDLATRLFPVIADAIDKFVIPAFKAGVDWLVKFIDGIDVGKIASFIDGLKKFDLRNINWEGIRESLVNIDWTKVSAKLIEGINSVDWNAVGITLGEALKTVWAVAKDIFNEVDWSGIFASLGTALMEFSTGLAGGSMDEFIDTWNENSKQLEQIIANLARIVANKIKEFIYLGKRIVSGLMTGIQSAWSSFIAWFTEKVQGIIDAALAALGVQSPSKVFKNIGRQIMAGLAQGIGQGVGVPVRAIMGAVPQLTGATITASGGRSINNHYYYGARILLERGQENNILATLTE